VSGTVDDPHKFAGMYLDGESGLYYTWFRMYDPTLGRWLAPDPIAGDASDPGSLNRYTYVGNNPVNRTDPLGLFEPQEWWVEWNAFNVWLWRAMGEGITSYVTVDTGGELTDPRKKKEKLDVSKTWEATFPCSMPATDLMATFKNNMGQFADNSVGPLIADFPAAPIQTGGNYDIYSGIFTFTEVGPVYVNRLNVTVTSETANGWTFTTNPQQHYIDGTVSFTARDAGNGNVNFAVTAKGNFATWFYKRAGPIIKAGEDSTWNNLLRNVGRYCAPGGGK
jgi:RHS repeat-associated protein